MSCGFRCRLQTSLAMLFMYTHNCVLPFRGRCELSPARFPKLGSVMTAKGVVRYGKKCNAAVVWNQDKSASFCDRKSLLLRHFHNWNRKVVLWRFSHFASVTWSLLVWLITSRQCSRLCKDHSRRFVRIQKLMMRWLMSEEFVARKRRGNGETQWRYRRIWLCDYTAELN